jgi:hypothetical protein
LRNVNATAKVVTRVTADPTGVVRGPDECRAGFLSAGEWTGAVSVPAYGSATVTIPVSISAALPGECRHVTWRLAYAAYSSIRASGTEDQRPGRAEDFGPHAPFTGTLRCRHSV